MGLSVIVDFIASGGGVDLSKSFETECGEAHGALADTKALQFILNDSLYGVLPLAGNLQICEKWETYVSMAPGILEKTVIDHEPVPSGWIESTEPPTAEREPKFKRTHARKEGQPSEELMNHVRGGHGEVEQDASRLLFLIFTFFSRGVCFSTLQRAPILTHKQQQLAGERHGCQWTPQNCTCSLAS